LDASEFHQVTFRAADLFVSSADRANRLIEELKTVSRDELICLKTQQGGTEEAIVCAICLESLLDRGTPDDDVFSVNALPCKHLFHTGCLSPWLATKATCPTCRLNLDPEHALMSPEDASLPNHLEMGRLLQILEQGHWSAVTSNTPVTYPGMCCTG
jgi:hypothetical protein